VNRVTACRLRDAGETIARELRRRAAGEPFSVTVPFPRLELEALLAGLGRTSAACWLPPDGDALLGWGEALATGGAGNDAPRLREAVSGTAIRHAGIPAERPLWLGGAPFDPDRPSGPPWEELEGPRFTLPRWLYRRPPEGPGTLTLFATALDGPGERDAALDEQLPELMDLPRRAAGWAPEAGGAVAPRIADLAPGAWEPLVERALAAITEGELDKVVLARRAEIRDEAGFDDASILHALGREAPESTRFAFRRGSTGFVGASPERLLLRHGLHIRTEAMAGTRALGPGRDAEALGRELLASEKDRAEHDWVRRGVVEALAPCCASLHAEESPAVRRLRHVVHLVTPIEGRLAGDLPLLDLARRLHPTPAVAGYPREAALRWLRRHEPTPRGWFAGPVGWFDLEGRGELRVALRSGVIRGVSLYAFAGAGIVPGSVPRNEGSEVLAKLRPLLRAAGCGT
jgi:isochorismate synthase